MAHYTNRIDVSLTPEQSAAVGVALQALLDALPFVVSVGSTERKHLFKLGAGSEAFVQQAHAIARENTEIIPGGLNVADLDRDAAVRDLLLPVEQQLSTLLTKIRDTRMLAGADLMQGAMIVYRALKAHGNGAGMNTLQQQLGQRFDRPGRTPEVPEEPTGTPAGEA
jgi:hypothetical protein